MLRWLGRIALTLLLLLAVLVGLALAMSKVDPVAWQPGPNPGLSGPFERNESLAAATLILEGAGQGPEDIARGPDGSFYTGVGDGRILRFDWTGEWAEYANTGGRPLGLEFAADGTLYVADALRGLLAVSQAGDVSVLADSFDNERLRFVDDLTVASDGTVWFTDASRRFGFGEHVYAFIEGRADGRLFSYSPDTGRITLRLADLFFANGVALGPDEEYLLIAETGAARVVRFWLQGPRTGHLDVFIDDLPGVPDNLSFNGSDLFWVALAGLRNADGEALADKPFIRKLLGALPAEALLGHGDTGFVVGIDLDGNVRFNLQASQGVYHTTTSVYEWDGSLFVGSVVMDAIAVLPLPPVSHEE